MRAPQKFARQLFRSAIILLPLAAALLAVRGALPIKPPANTLQLTSTAFSPGQPIPPEHTCDGKNISPPLKWTGAPAGTKSFVLIVEDPDAAAGVFAHWVVFDLAATTTELPGNITKAQPIDGKARQGVNDFKNAGYGGPCPPAGKLHRYVFKIHALDTFLDLKPTATKREVEAAMIRHVLSQGQLIGIYQRNK
jgi:Raf kinase inhibitor-like YbhB/YbcL family protein